MVSIGKYISKLLKSNKLKRYLIIAFFILILIFISTILLLKANVHNSNNTEIHGNGAFDRINNR